MGKSTRYAIVTNHKVSPNKASSDEQSKQFDDATESQAEPGSQSERFIAKARELGLDEREETFDAALTKVAKAKVAKAPTKV